VCGVCGVWGVWGCALLTFDIPQTALVATLDTYDFISRVPKNCLNQLDVNKQSLIRAHCSMFTVARTNKKYSTV
jgi:hypothetical protein